MQNMFQSFICLFAFITPYLFPEAVLCQPKSVESELDLIRKIGREQRAVPSTIANCNEKSDCLVVVEKGRCDDWFYAINRLKRNEYENWIKPVREKRLTSLCADARASLPKDVSPRECESKVKSSLECHNLKCEVGDWESVCVK